MKIGLYGAAIAGKVILDDAGKITIIDRKPGVGEYFLSTGDLQKMSETTGGIRAAIGGGDYRYGKVVREGSNYFFRED